MLQARVDWEPRWRCEEEIRGDTTMAVSFAFIFHKAGIGSTLPSAQSNICSNGS